MYFWKTSDSQDLTKCIYKRKCVTNVSSSGYKGNPFIPLLIKENAVCCDSEFQKENTTQMCSINKCGS